MKPLFIKHVIAFFAACGLLASATAFGQFESSKSPSLDAPEGGYTPPPGSVILYGQLTGPLVNGGPSQDLDPGFETFDSQIAEDFSTDASNWEVREIFAVGIAEAPPVFTANAWIYASTGPTPGAAVCTYPALPVSDDGVGNLTIPLPSPCALDANTAYWVSVQVVGGDGASQWFWGNQTALVGEPGQFRNPGNGFGTGCIDWNDAGSVCGVGGGNPEYMFAIAGIVAGGRATFDTSKNFNDNNEAEVEVTLSCNTGLPLEQTTTISEGDPVNFVINDFEPGTLDCTITEVVPDGYTASYNDGTVSASNCSYEDITGGAFSCVITNSLNQVEVEVDKVWIDENPQFNAVNIADASWSCTNVAFGTSSGSLEFFGNPGEDSFFVFPDWESGTNCSVTEVNVPDGGVEVDDSDCDSITVWPGIGGACTIYNTRLYEGIPTLSQYGLAVLALLMLSMGFVAFRRLI